MHMACIWCSRIDLPLGAVRRQTNFCRRNGKRMRDDDEEPPRRRLEELGSGNINCRRTYARRTLRETYEECITVSFSFSRKLCGRRKSPPALRLTSKFTKRIQNQSRRKKYKMPFSF